MRDRIAACESDATRIAALEAEVASLKAELKVVKKVARKVVVVGNALTTADYAVGYVFLLDGALPTGRVIDWAFFGYSAGRALTPLLLQRQLNGTFTVIGIGQARTNTGAGIERFPFSMTAGRVEVDGSCRLGWKDGTNGTDNAGVVCYDTNGPIVRWFGKQTNLAVGDNYTEVPAGNAQRLLSAVLCATLTLIDADSVPTHTLIRN